MSDQTRTADDLTASHADPNATTGGDTRPQSPSEVPPDLTRVFDLAAEYHAAIADGRSLALADLCREHPHLLPHVQSVLQAGEQVAAVAQADNPLPQIKPANHTRYAIGEAIARGGMGEVYRATDTVLNREVAIKVLQPKYAPGSTTARRFDDEARITAQLQHPGIPAVHDLGTLPDGRPFLAMKLIKGETLDKLLKDRDPAKLELGRFIPVFEQICHALAYAHARGVIHRDLKPANVMVGSFNETQVMDWGLAKVLVNRGCEPAGASSDDTADPDPTEIKSLRDAETQAGSIMGTPAFMAPEQAIGAVERIDRRTDVFGLGAILAVVLTGKPPFQGDSAESTRQLAAMGKVGDCFVRLDGCGAEPELVALCKRCLSPDPVDRPVNADAVAKAVANLRATADDRARKAEIDRERAEVAAGEQRKRRRVLQWAGGVVVGVLVAGIVGTLIGLLEAQRQTDIAQGQTTEAERQEGIAREQQTESKRQEAIARTQESEARRHEGIAKGETAEKVKALGAEKEANADLWAGLDAMTSEIIGDSLGGQAALSEEQKKFLTSVLPLYQKLAAKKGDDEATRARVARAAVRVGRIESRVGRIVAGAAAHRQACDAFEKLAIDFPAVPGYRLELATSLNSLGENLIRLREWKAAGGELHKELALLEKLAGEHPGVPEYLAALVSCHTNLGNLHSNLREWKAAEVQCQKGLTILEKLTAESPHVRKYRVSQADLHNNLGVVLTRQEEWKAAEEQFRKGLAVQERLVADVPTDTFYLSSLARSHNNLGSFLSWLREWKAAEEQYRKGLAILENVAARLPSVPMIRVDLGGCYCNFGHHVREGGQPADSLEWFDKAIKTLEPIHRAEPRDATAKQFLRNSHRGRAMANDRLSRFAEAVKDWDRTVELSPKEDQPKYRAPRAASRMRAGLVAEAVAEVGELRRLSQWDVNTTYDFACVYAVASGKIADEKQNYADRAMEMLNKAKAGGFKDAARLKADKQFDPIRERDDFKKLVADLEANFPLKETLPPPREDK